jgi:hypothetical protein
MSACGTKLPKNHVGYLVATGGEPDVTEKGGQGRF